MSAPTLPNSMDLNDILWMGMQSTPALMTFYTALGVVLMGMVFSSILIQCNHYFEDSKQCDGPVVKAYIIVGTPLALGQLALGCAQVYELTQHAFADYASVLRFDLLSSFMLMITALYFSVSAPAFYSWRAWKLSGRSFWLLPFLVLSVVGVLASSLPGLVVGLQIPEISLDNLPALETYFEEIGIYLPAWGFAALGCDSFVCFAMMFYLIRQRNRIFDSQTRVLRRIIVVVFETMLPPVVVMLVLVSSYGRQSSMMADYRRTCFTVLPLLYFHSLLHSLTSRSSIRDILDASLASSGADYVGRSGEVVVTKSILTYGSASRNAQDSAFAPGRVKARHNLSLDKEENVDLDRKDDWLYGHGVASGEDDASLGPLGQVVKQRSAEDIEMGVRTPR